MGCCGQGRAALRQATTLATGTTATARPAADGSGSLSPRILLRPDCLNALDGEPFRLSFQPPNH